LTDYYKLNLKAAVGRVVEHLGNVQSSRKDAETLVKYTFFNLAPNGVIGDLEVLRRERSSSVIPEELFDRYEKALKRLEVPAVQKTVKCIIGEMKNKNYSEALCRAKLGKMIDAFVKRLENCSGHGNDGKKIYSEIMNSDNIDELQERLFEKLENSFDYDQCEKNRESAMTIKKAPDLVGMAKEYTVRNLEKDVSLYVISEYIGVSPQYFSKIFKEETGENYMDFLTMERMERAKKIIRESSDISIEELYSRVGYSSASYFIKKFKETYNMTPNTFRKIVKNERNNGKM
jgi:YesN/AraC family two-component response regulator